MGRFLDESRPEALAHLTEGLIEMEDSSILPRMLSIAADPSRSREQRLAALAVIDGRNEHEALGGVSEIVRSELDPDVLRAALHAIPDGQAFGRSEIRPVAEAIRRVLTLPTQTHQGAKEAAWILLARWFPPDRPSVLTALRNDPSARIRAAAAFGLIYATEHDADTLRALAAVVANEQEDHAVRSNAWRALGAAGVLPDEVLAAYRSFSPE